MLEKVKILELTSDIVFKSFMLSEDTKEYTARLISLITKIPEKEILKNAVFNNVELPVKNKSDKRYRTDIIITIVKNIINIEMNREYYDGLFSKNNAYISKLYSDQFDVGDSYTNISKIIGINIDNFSKFRGNKFVYKFLPMEIETKEIEEENRESYHLDLEYLRNKCYNNDKLSELEKMCQIFIEEDFEHLENLKKGDDVMTKAVNKLEEISKDDKIIGLYDAETVDRKVWNSKILYAEKIGTERGMEKGLKKGMKEGMKKGIKEGIEKGIEKGFQEGKKNNQLLIVQNMLNKGFDKETIIEITGITLDELNFLIK